MFHVISFAVYYEPYPDFELLYSESVPKDIYKCRSEMSGGEHGYAAAFETYENWK